MLFLRVFAQTRARVAFAVQDKRACLQVPRPFPVRSRGPRRVAGAREPNTQQYFGASCRNEKKGGARLPA
eukprot:8877573-Alexandrium_andersonii.AAC.1